MRRPMPRPLALGAAAALVTACSLGKPEGPKREAVLSLLQQEAQALKQEGEKVDPALGVKATWNVESVDVREQPGKEAQPWAGTIRFKIESRMKEVDGSLLTQEFEKRFEYVYSTAMSRWIIQYTPPTPVPRKN